jgi:hypothetical protein
MRRAIHWPKVDAHPEPMRTNDTQRRMMGSTLLGPKRFRAMLEGGPARAYVMTGSLGVSGVVGDSPSHPQNTERPMFHCVLDIFMSVAAP